MDQLFDLDSLSAAIEWKRGHVFERPASVTARPERRTPGP